MMNDTELMRRAIALSIESVKNGGGPFGAVIARNGEIVSFIIKYNSSFC